MPPDPKSVPQPPTVLVVDDDRDTADALCDLLQLHGFPTLVAYDGDDAVAAAVEHQPRVAILDLHMPRMSGLVACTRIRQDPATQRMRLVALTGSDSAVDREAAHLAGFDHFLMKPVMVSALLHLLSAAPF